MQKTTLIIASIVILFHHTNNPAASPSKHPILMQSIQSPVSEMCLCDSCAFFHSAKLFHSPDQAAHIAGKSFLRSIVKEEKPFEPFARITLATHETDSKKCHDLLFPVVKINTNNLPNNGFALHQLIASNLMMLAYQKEQKNYSACIAACNTYAIAHNNELDPTQPTIKEFLSSSIQQIYDYTKSNPDRKLSETFPDFDSESAEILTKLQTHESACLRGKIALETTDTKAAWQFFHAAYKLSEENTIVFLNTCKTPLASTILGNLYFKKFKKKRKESDADSILLNLFNLAKNQLLSSAIPTNPLGVLIYANFLHKSMPSISQADSLEKIYLNLINNDLFISKALSGLADINSFRFLNSKDRKKDEYATKAMQLYTKAMKISEESKNDKEYAKSAIKLMNLMYLQPKTSAKLNAANIAQSLQERYPTDATVLTKCAKFHLKCTKNISLAKQLAIESLKIDPTKKATHYLINKMIINKQFKILNDNDDLDKIDNFAHEVISIAQNQREANLHFARKCFKQEKIDESIKHFHASINPNDAYEYYDTGVTILSNTLLVTGALPHPESPLFPSMKSFFKKAVEMNPDNPSYLNYLHKAYIIEKKDKKAVSSLEKAAKRNCSDSIAELSHFKINGYGGSFSPREASELFKYNATICTQNNDHKMAFIYTIMGNLAFYQDPVVIKKLIEKEDELFLAIADFEKMSAKIEHPKCLNEIFYTLGLLHLAAEKLNSDPIKKRNCLFKANISFNKIKDESDSNPRYFYYKAKSGILLANATKVKVKESVENAIKLYEEIINTQEKLSPNHHFIKKSSKELYKIYTNILEQPEIGLTYLERAQRLENPNENPGPICSSTC